MGRAPLPSSDALMPWKQNGKVIVEDLAWRIVYKKYLLDVSSNLKISQDLLVSVASVRRVLRRFALEGDVMPEHYRSHAGKLLASLTDGQAFRLFDMIADADAADTLVELRSQFYEETGLQVGLPVMCAAMRKLGYTRKRLTAYIKRRDELASRRWKLFFRENFTPEQILAIDETSKDDRAFNRTYGFSPRGKPAISRRGFYGRGNRWSSLGVFSLQGMVDCVHKPGGFKKASFLAAVRDHVIPHVGVFPLEPQCVVLADNCRIHKQREFVQMVEAAGGLVLWLPPYCPEHNPIEKAFRLIKNDLRFTGEEFADMSNPWQLDRAFNRIGSKAARHCFKACDY